MQQQRFDRFNYWLKTGITLLLVITLSLGLGAAKANRSSSLPAGNPITDAKALLRDALPIDNAAVRQLQKSLEDISVQLRANRRWGAAAADVKKASTIVSHPDTLLASIPAAKKTEASTLISQLSQGMTAIQAAIAAKDKEQIRTLRSQLLDIVGQLEESMVQKFPYEVPTEYSNLPQLKGRATIAFTTSKGTVTAVVDGYSAPVTAGNFVDLVQRGFYNGLPFTRAEDFYVLQVGDPPGSEDGFIDPVTKKYRAVPLEVLVQGDAAPTYGITLEDAGRYKDLPVLPFSAYGALAMARPGDDPNGGSSQFFFFLFEPELTPAGLNLLDGRYSVFGYVIEGEDVLGKLKAGDTIQSATVIRGLDNLQPPSVA
jgi:peptidylprolyl isomerase